MEEPNQILHLSNFRYLDQEHRRFKRRHTNLIAQMDEGRGEEDGLCAVGWVGPTPAQPLPGVPSGSLGNFLGP
jgi:hypothetical protein